MLFVIPAFAGIQSPIRDQSSAVGQEEQGAAGDDRPLPDVIMLQEIVESTMGIFFPKHFFLPEERGFLLLIGNWVDFSTEFDSAFGNYRQHKQSNKKQESMRGLYN